MRDTKSVEGRHGPLEGLRVVDLTRIVSGPLCGRLLADLGADVVKIEAPQGDVTRQVGPVVDGVSAYYAQMNAGKRHMCLDLAQDGGAEVVARLAAQADVLIENFRPGVTARHGLDAPTLLERNPLLVYCSITGWGQDGPWSDRRAAAPLIHTEVGAVSEAAFYRQRPFEHDIHQHADVYTATIASNAILAALVERARTGRGQHLDVAMAQAAVYTDDWAAVGLHEPVDRFSGFDTWNSFFYPLGDGSHVTILGDPVMLFEPWVRALGGAHLLTDPRFATAEARASHPDDVLATIRDLTAAVPDAEALQATLAGAMVAEVRPVADLAHTEWAAHRGLMTEVAPGNPVPAAPWQSSTSRIGARPTELGLGAHNDTVLSELGYHADDVAALRASGTLLGG